VPIMYGTWLGPVLVALGSLLGRGGLLRAGSLVGAGAAGVMADIGRSEVVPGANDNLSAVAVLVALGRALSERPSPGVRVLLLSTGSEESFMEGMQGFMRRHRGALDPDRTTVLCLECVGSPTLTLIEAEGMLRMRPYSDAARRRLADAAAALDVELLRGLRTVAATDALIALRRGYAAATLASVDETRFPANYHWPSDTPENLDWDTIGRAFAVTEGFVRAGAPGWIAARPSRVASGGRCRLP
jgi:Zn-dependent M28 family amino/carboxypeptidase